MGRTGDRCLGGANTRALAVFFVVVVAAFGPGARAALQAVGPVSAGNGFPLYYQDTDTVTIRPCLDQDGLCPPIGLPNPAAPIHFPDNFPEEVFYWLASATSATNNGGTALLTLALEGSFASAPAIVDGQQLVFARIRIRADNLEAGATYTVTHPFGTDTFTNVAGGLRGINSTENVGFVPLQFSLALTGRIGPFLQWNPAESAPPPGTLGDPAILHTIIGSPTGNNVFRITGPNVGGPGVNTIETSLFSVSGKLFSGAVPSPLTVDRVTYYRDTTARIAAFATSTPAAVLDFSGGAVPPTPLNGSGSGKFLGIYNHPDPAAALPAAVTVRNTADNPPTQVIVEVADEVTITRAFFDPQAASLTVEAHSSDTLGSPILTAVGFGPLSGGVLFVSPIGVPPSRVLVSSSAGGVDSEPVSVGLPAATANVPPTANAGPDVTAPAGVVVTFDGSASFDPEGAPLSFTWNFGDGSPTASGAIVSHSFATQGSYTVTLVVSDGVFGGGDTALATISAPPIQRLYFTVPQQTSLPGLGLVQNEDIVSVDLSTGVFSLAFDGSDVGLTTTGITAFTFLPGGDLLLSISPSILVAGLTGGPGPGTVVAASDVIRFAPTSLGPNTAGSFSFFFDGSDVGLTLAAEAIDALALRNGNLVLSIVGTGNVNGLVAPVEDEDLIELSATTLGAATSGSFSLLFDGSDVGLATNDGEDVDAAFLGIDGRLYLSTVGAFSVTGASGGASDVFRFTPGTFGATTSGTFDVFRTGASLGIPVNVRGLSIQ